MSPTFPRRVVRILLIVLCLTIAAEFAMVRVGQYVLRHRAERLISDLGQLEPGHSSWKDVQRLMTSWGANGDHRDSCTEQKCEYQFWLEDWVGEVGSRVRNSSRPFRYSFFPLAVMLPLFRWHEASLSAAVDVLDGKVQETRFTLMTDVPKGDGPENYRISEYALMASVRAYGPAHRLGYVWPAWWLHPGYVVREPTGCMDCLQIYSELKPGISPDDRRRLSGINLNCITRWSPCTVEADIFLAAWEQRERDSDAEREFRDHTDDCSFPVSELARAAQQVLVMRTTSTVRGQGNDASVDVQLIKTLKGSPNWGNPVHRVSLFPEWLDRTKPLAVVKGTDLIILSTDDLGREPSQTILFPEICGAFLATPENLANAKAGVQQGMTVK